MKAWLVIPPVVVLFGAACIPGPADPSPPPGALAEGVVELARSSEALDGLVLESLQESASDEISLTLAELDGQAGEVEFFLPAQTMTARLLGLEFLPGPDAWMVAGSMEVAGLDARVGYSLAGGGSGECRLRVNVPLRDIHFQLEASPDTPSLDVGPAEVDGERTGIELEPGCPLADLPVFAEQLAAAVVQAGNLGAQQLAGRVAQALATVLGASGNWNGTVSAAWSASGWDGGLGYSISAGAASLWLGAQAAGTRFTGGFWSQPSACLPAGTIDLPAQPLEPVDLDSLLAGQGQAVAALAVSDGFVAQAVVAAWRAGLFCRAPEAGACPGLQLEEWLPSAVSWAGRETRLLLATEAAPLVELAGSNPQGALPAVEVSWPEVRFDF
ncbi:MAG: hypothetical protein DRI34_11370, partial [Deltaproteobacteria bacterium]